MKSSIADPAMALAASIAAALLLLLGGAAAKSFIESCNTAAQCSSMVAYRSPTSQSLDAIAALFNVDPIALLGANNLDLAAPPSIVPAQDIIKVPISCSCVDGIWRGNATLYKIKPGDTLSYVADHLFAKLVTYKQIAQANAIANYGSVAAGTVLVIPFSCGCSNPFGGNQLGILLSYVVQPGDTVQEIVVEYGSAASDFMSLNTIGNASELAAGDVVAVPIHACGSSLRRSAYDYGLVVANGSYLVTAGHCVQCSCLPNLQQVYCTPASSIISGSCPTMKCLGTNLTIGEMITATSAGQGCNVTSCLYTGYKKKIILSSLQSVTLTSCPAPPPSPNYKSSSGSIALPPAEAPSASSGLTTPGIIPSSQSAFAPGPATAAAAKFPTKNIALQIPWLLLLLLLLAI